jgi:hypothetical protein
MKMFPKIMYQLLFKIFNNMYSEILVLCYGMGLRRDFHDKEQ